MKPCTGCWAHLNFARDQTNGVTRLLVFRTAPGAATEPVAAEKKDYRIANEDLVKLKRGASTNAIDQTGQKARPKVIGRDDRTGLYRLQFDDADSAAAGLQALASDPSVAAAGLQLLVDRPTPAQMTQVPNASGPLFNFNPQPAANGPIVGLVDTSVDPPLNSRPTCSPPSTSPARPGHSGPPTQPRHRHVGNLGDAMANDPSKSCRSTFMAAASRQTYEVMEGVLAAINAGANPINLSRGGTGDSAVARILIQEANQKGIVFVAAAGKHSGRRRCLSRRCIRA